ncbi:MAG: cellulase family glycosylhydrolase, partial [Desulfobacterales bacterium]
HTLILAGIWGSISSLSTLNLPKEETNFIVTIHFYEPLLFTHQGAGWIPKEYGTVGVIWPGPPETKLHPILEASSVDWVQEWFIRYNCDFPDINPAGPRPIMEALDNAVAWSEKHGGVPLWIGEFGAYKKADMQSRVKWTKFVREQAEVRNIPWAYWEFGAEFGVYDRKVQDWNKGLLEALIPIERKDHMTLFQRSESLIDQSEDLCLKSQIEFVE